MDLCWVAAGRFDGFYEHKLQAWDSAAGFLIVEEAGGRSTTITGMLTIYEATLLSTTRNIHDEALEILR